MMDASASILHTPFHDLPLQTLNILTSENTDTFSIVRRLTVMTANSYAV
jgi:hypothetical protein